MGIYESIKEIVTLVKKIDNLELYRRILDLQAEVQQFTTEQAKKEARIAELEESLQFKERLVRDGQDYFEMDENGAATGYAYCSHCWEVDHVAVHIREDPIESQWSVCPRCKNSFNWRGYKGSPT